MNAEPKPNRKADGALAGTVLLMILCCAVGPAVLGAAAGSLVGGWLGVVCALALAAGVVVVMHRRRRGTGC